MVFILYCQYGFILLSLASSRNTLIIAEFTNTSYRTFSLHLGPAELMSAHRSKHKVISVVCDHL